MDGQKSARRWVGMAGARLPRRVPDLHLHFSAAPNFNNLLLVILFRNRNLLFLLERILNHTQPFEHIHHLVEAKGYRT